MKFGIFIISTLIASSAFASKEVSFSCDFTDITYMSQFSLTSKKVVIDDEGKFSNTEFDFTLRKAGPDQATERLVVTRDGSTRFFEAGDIYNHASSQILSVIKGDNVEMINLLIDMPPALNSQIRLLDGTTYRGTCKSL